MAKKKMSVADILAAARNADGKTDGDDAAHDEVTSAEEPQAAEAASEEAKPAAEAPAPKPGGKMSTADILAMARAGKKPAEAAKPEKAAPAKKAPAPAAKESPKPAAKAGAKAGKATAAAMDTASILAAARKSTKAGPMSKEEAAAKAPHPSTGATEKKAAAKAKPTVPAAPTKPDYAKPKPAKPAAAAEDRRGFLSVVLGTFMGLGFMALSATTALWTLATARFMFPNVLMEPPSQFKVGPPSNYPLGYVETKFKGQFGVWVVHGIYSGQEEIYALSTVCTHLGCTPNWLEAEQKFKCPCHGSGFYKDGINFEGPAPRPLERYAIQVADDGQLEVDKSKKFQEEMDQWSDPACFVPV